MTSTTFDVGLAERSARALFAAATKYATNRAGPTRGLSALDTYGPKASESSGAPAPSLQSVLDCIKAHESGNYSEHSHIWDGSGAYQAIPGTWRHYANEAGYPGYAFEYLAPPSVQDAVISFMLTHGGAHNYSPKFGNDPCTVGIP